MNHNATDSCVTHGAIWPAPTEGLKVPTRQTAQVELKRLWLTTMARYVHPAQPATERHHRPDAGDGPGA